MASLPTRMQAARLPNLSVVWQDEDGNARTLTQNPSGFMTNINTGVTIVITGTMVFDADQVTNKGVFLWTLSAADVATPGRYSVYFIETVSAKDYKSRPVSWAIVTAPTA